MNLSLNSEPNKAMSSYQLRIVECKSCGTKNRIGPYSSALRPICSICKTPLEDQGEPKGASDFTGKSSRSYTEGNASHYADGFSYSRYIQNIDVNKLIEKSTVFGEAKGHQTSISSKCIYCNQSVHGPAIRLNNGDYICEACFTKIQTIKYPELYQGKFEEYLKRVEARRIALEEFIAALPEANRISNLESLSSLLSKILGGVILISVLGLLFSTEGKGIWFLGGIIATGSIYGLLSIVRSILENCENTKKNKISYWCQDNPEPEEPLLKEFHDPTAELTENDRKVLEVLDYWPGYPPYWKYVRDVVLRRDTHRCQVSGCPSRTELHIHHKKPISSGGSHRIENLVSLCVG